MFLCYCQDDEVEDSLSFRISKNNPGESFRYEFNGKDVYDLVEEMKELGLYKAETQSE